MKTIPYVLLNIFKHAEIRILPFCMLRDKNQYSASIQSVQQYKDLQVLLASTTLKSFGHNDFIEIYILFMDRVENQNFSSVVEWKKKVLQVISSC